MLKCVMIMFLLVIYFYVYVHNVIGVWLNIDAHVMCSVNDVN